VSPGRSAPACIRRLLPFGPAGILGEVEHLTKANGIGRQQQKSHEKRSNVTGERAKSHEKHVADHIRDAQRHHGPRQHRGDKEGSPDQSTHIGNGDVSEEDFQKAIEDGVVRDVVGIEPELNEDFCESEIVGCLVEDPIQVVNSSTLLR
jgi:hypothetical protein